jgi:hypothetical protein
MLLRAPRLFAPQAARGVDNNTTGNDDDRVGSSSTTNICCFGQQLPAMRGALWLRKAMDLEHTHQPELALQTYEAALADPAVAGQWRVAAARGLDKMWKPPREGWHMPALVLPSPSEDVRPAH